MPFSKPIPGARRALRLVVLTALAAAAAGCAPREEILKGERFEIRKPLSETQDIVSDPVGDPVDLEDDPLPNRSRAISLDPPSDLSSWTHAAAVPANKVPHLNLASDISRVWSAPIGAGNSRKKVITATPVIAGGRIFTMDSDSVVAAHSTSGEALWTADLVPESEAVGDASSGGLAYGGGMLFATTGYGSLHAIAPATGEIAWTHKFGAAAISPPAVQGGTAYVVTADSRAWAIGTADGRVKWRLESVEAAAAIHGESSPALAGGRAIFPFPSGELVGADVRTGRSAWTASVAGARLTGPRFAMAGLSSPPVLDGDLIFAANQAGRMSAISARSGAVQWSAREGANSAVLPAGDSVFVVTDAAELVRLDAGSGERIWGAPLPEFKNQRLRRRKDVYANFGPVLAGGRLIVASSDGFIRHFDPVSGGLLGTTDLPGGASSRPVVVEGVLYLTTDRGELLAFQ